MAAHILRREGPGQTLQPTALVHEAYLRLERALRAGGEPPRRQPCSGPPHRQPGRCARRCPATRSRRPAAAGRPVPRSGIAPRGIARRSRDGRGSRLARERTRASRSRHAP
ncbi:MAG: hypothetical protein QUU85_19245 [Candidatus Eisenbacteria bacterium]|nr:hypothetical protein [Candidatus Eisenbacteria bacterium]